MLLKNYEAIKLDDCSFSRHDIVAALEDRIRQQFSDERLEFVRHWTQSG